MTTLTKKKKSPHVKGIRIAESGKFLLVESRILGFGIRSSAQGIRNPTKDWNLESKFHAQIMRYPVPEIRNPGREI